VSARTDASVPRAVPGGRERGERRQYGNGSDFSTAMGMLTGEPRDAILEVLATAASKAFELLEPSLGGDVGRGETCVPAGASSAAASRPGSRVLM
jgi:hypothetical protein